MSHPISIRCIQCHESYPSGSWQQECRCGGLLNIRYDLEGIRASLQKADLANRPLNIWRYQELLPVSNPAAQISLGEGCTPVLHLRKIGEALSLPLLFTKDEGRNPTGTFKDRGAAVGISMAHAFGIRDIAVPTMGSAGAAWSAYGAAAGIRIHVSIPEGLPPSFENTCRQYGADLEIFKGDFASEAARRHEDACQRGWASATTLREPYRLEGKKTLLFEIAEYWGWRLPDVVLCPTGGGVQLLAIWKAYRELQALGWIENKPPRLIAVQAAGVAPVVKAWQAKQAVVERWPKITTQIPGFMVSRPRAGALVLEILRQSNGAAIAIEDNLMLSMAASVAQKEGLLISPEGAAAIVAAGELRKRGIIDEDERVITINTANGLRYL